MRVLVIEDGHEYIDTLSRFLPDDFTWKRAGSGAVGLTEIASGEFDAVFLDMRFDRVPDDALLGDLAATADRFNGDLARARHFLQENQGTLVLSAIRSAGHTIPVLLSYAFDEEPRRWKRLSASMGPVDYVPDAAGPSDIALRLRTLIRG